MPRRLPASGEKRQQLWTSCGYSTTLQQVCGSYRRARGCGLSWCGLTPWMWVTRCGQWLFSAPRGLCRGSVLSRSLALRKERCAWNGRRRGGGFHSRVLALSHSAMAEGAPAPFGSLTPRAARLGRRQLCHPVLVVPGTFLQGLALPRTTVFVTSLLHHSTLLRWKRPAGRQGACEPAALATKGPGASPLGAHGVRAWPGACTLRRRRPAAADTGQGGHAGPGGTAAAGAGAGVTA